MTDLNNRKQIAAIDKANALGSIEQLPEQCEQALNECSEITLPDDYPTVSNVVVTGMGASWLGAHIMQGLLADRLTKPLLVLHDYQVPEYVSGKTLVIASSYSGTTEETISAMGEAQDRDAKVITISTGGDLAKFATANQLPHYTYIPIHNPAHSPRLGLGYSIVAQMVLLSKIGLVSITSQEITDMIIQLKKRVAELTIESPDNPAKQMAREAMNFMPIVAAGTFLLGNAHAWANQFNETAKTFSTYMQIPELNHHLMEGLAHPVEVQKLKFLFLESDLYDERVKKRFSVTKEVVEQNKITHFTYQPKGGTKLIQAFDTLLFGSFVTFYLAMLNGVDPAPNPYVDYFKKRLKEI